jgi:Arc/MetJ-type ribon-helix-helix transcriptional regulator
MASRRLLHVAVLPGAHYKGGMKNVNVRLPEPLIAEIEAESRARGISRSDVLRDRLQRAPAHPDTDPLASIRDLIGSVDGGRADLSSRKKEYLRALIRAKHNR